MQMAASMLANEFVGHGAHEKSKPRPFKPERVGHPERLNEFLSVDVLEWYHPIATTRQQKKCEKVDHPPKTSSDNDPPNYSRSQFEYVIEFILLADGSTDEPEVQNRSCRSGRT